MKNTLIIATFALLIIGIPSCTVDNPLNPGNPSKTEPIILEDRYDDDITLSDHNEDGVDYIATDEIEIYGGRMTIEPGVTIEFEEGASFVVAIDGRLDAKGTSGEPIRMIAKEGEPSWAGIYINSDKANKLEHVIIEHAGKGKSYGVFNDFQAALTLDGRVSVENTTITKSGDMGIILNDANSTTLEEFSGNTIKDCESAPILTNINYLDALNLSDNSYTDNGENMITITDRYSNRLSVETTLSGLEIPYLFSGKFELYENLTLERGVEVVMDQNSLLSHDAADDFRLEVRGTETDHVVIRGKESQNGYWQGIYITSKNNANVFEYLDISDGGGEKLTFREGMANISLEWGAKLEMTECTSTRSGSCEIFLSNFGEAPTFTNNSPAITDICEE